MKILFVTNIPSPYRVDFFNELGKHCELTVLFERHASTERDSSWAQYQFQNFKGIIMSGIPVSDADAICLSVGRYIRRNAYDRIIITNYATPTGWLEVLCMKIKGIPYMIEGDGAFPCYSKGIVPSIKSAMKKWLFSGATACFSTASSHDDYYLRYGVPSQKIRRYPFTSIRHENILDKPLSPEEKVAIRVRLGIPEEKMVLSVGQFIHRKGFDILLQAVSTLDRSIGVYIIGGTPTDEMQAYVQKHTLTNVHFLPFQLPDVLREYYKAADIFALPTREDIWGLVVNEAMSLGLPVVTTDKCVAGLELVREGENGFIVPVEDPDRLLEAINRALNDDLMRLANSALETARMYTIQSMVDAHMRILENC